MTFSGRILYLEAVEIGGVPRYLVFATPERFVYVSRGECASALDCEIEEIYVAYPRFAPSRPALVIVYLFSGQESIFSCHLEMEGRWEIRGDYYVKRDRRGRIAATIYIHRDLMEEVRRGLMANEAFGASEIYEHVVLRREHSPQKMRPQFRQ